MRIGKAQNSHLIQWGLNVLYIFSDYIMILQKFCYTESDREFTPLPHTNSVSEMWSCALLELPAQISNRPMRQFVYISDVIGR